MGIDTIQTYYDQNVQREWDRMDEHPIEFLLTKHQLDQYIKPGQTVLDLGGGPGRYALYLSERGCQVTLMDLSQGNIDFAKQKAEQAGLKLEALQGNALQASEILSGQSFDHVLVMGPLYHLLNEADRTIAVRSALSLTKPGGRAWFAFLLIGSGIIYYMSTWPEMIGLKSEDEYLACVKESRSYAGPAFTEAFFIDQKEILPFMAQFHLEDQHCFGQESILAQFEPVWKGLSPELKQLYIDLAIALQERPEFLSYNCHAIVHGIKPHSLKLPEEASQGQEMDAAERGT